MSNSDLLYLYILKYKYSPIKTTYYTHTTLNNKICRGYKIRFQHPTQDFTTDLVLWESGTKRQLKS